MPTRKAVRARKTRLREWRQAHLAKNLCIRCSKPRRHYATRCDQCALLERRGARAREGMSAWKPGGPGRPPLVRERVRRRRTRRRRRGG